MLVPFIGRSIHERALMLDSSPLISLYDRNDPRRDEIKNFLHTIQAKSYPVYITLPIIAETHRNILHNFGRNKGVEFLSKIFDGTIIIIQVEEMDQESALDIIGKFEDQQITLVDALTMAVMDRVGVLNILTFDHAHFSLMNFIICP